MEFAGNDGSAYNPFAGGGGSPNNNSFDMFNNNGNVANNVVRRREDGPHNGPIRTAGQISLKNFENEDLSLEPFMGRDATIMIEGELR